jgi:hypothetical protein
VLAVTVRQVALGTDIGTDVDDLLAPVTGLGSPGSEPMAVTTVSGDTLHRARITRKAPVVPGESRSDFTPDALGRHRIVTGFDVQTIGLESERRILRVVEGSRS